MIDQGEPQRDRGGDAPYDSDVEVLRAIGERLRSVRKARGLVQSDLGEAVGVSRAAVSQWEKGEAEAALTKLALAAEHLQTNLTWLVTGRGEPPETPSGKSRQRARPAAPGVVGELANAIGSGVVDADDEIDWWRIPPAHLRRLGTRASSTKILRVDSAAMAPTINRGAHVLVDFAQTTPHDGQVYAIHNEISLLLCRLHVRPARRARKVVELAMDSEPGRTVQVRLSNLKIAGRVIGELIRPL